MLHFIEYVSIAAQAVDNIQLASILVVSRKNNEQRSLTGVLTFVRGRFHQHLEGPAAEVRRTFEAIRRDVRHSSIDVLADEAVTERMYPMWTMASGDIVTRDEFVGTLTRLRDLGRRGATPGQRAGIERLIDEIVQAAAPQGLAGAHPV